MRERKKCFRRGALKSEFKRSRMDGESVGWGLGGRREDKNVKQKVERQQVKDKEN